MPLPIVFSRRFDLRRAPTRGAPTDCLLSAFGPGKGTHKGCPYRLSSLGVLAWGGRPQGVPLPIVFSPFGPGKGTHKGCPYRLSSLGVLALGRAPTRGAPTDCLLSAFGPFGPGKGTHKGCPYRLSSLGVWPWEGHPQGAPLPTVFSRRSALGRAPTRGAPTDCLLSAFGPGKGTHKGCPYRLSSLGVWPWEGQGVPLPIVFSRRFALGRAPTRGAPTDCLLSAFGPGKGTHKGCLPVGRAPQGVPLPIVFSRRLALGRAPTRGAPTDCLLSAFGPGKGTHKGCPYRLSSLGVLAWEGHPQGVPLPTHKGCPYRLSSLGVWPWEGHPQGVPLPIVFSRRSALGRAPTRGAPTDCLLSAFGPGKGTHKGCPYRLSSLGVWPWEGHPQGVPLPIVFSRRSALGRAPTRGAPTDCLLSAFCPGKGTHKGCPYRLSSLGVWPWEGHPQGVPLPKGTHKGRPYRLSSLGVWPWEGRPQGVPLPIVFSRRSALGRAPTRGAPTRFRQPHEVFSNLMQLPWGVEERVKRSEERENIFACLTQGRELTMAA